MYLGLKNPHKAGSNYRKKEYLYSVETNDKQFTPVYREDLKAANGHHHWWYKLMVKGDDGPTEFKDKDGQTIHLNDILLVPNFDSKDIYSWSVAVAMEPEKYSRHEKEKTILRQIHIGWDYRIRVGKPESQRENMTAYTDECIIIGQLRDIVRPDGYLIEYDKTIKSPDGMNVN